MEPHTQTDDSDKSRSLLEAQLRDCFGRAAYSHKTHEKCADIFAKRQARFRVTQIVLAAITTGGYIGVFLGKTYIASIIGGSVSLCLLVLNSYLKESNLAELVQRHKRAASELWFIRESYFSLLTDLAMGERPIENLQNERDKLLVSLDQIHQAAPPTIDEAYARAQKALQSDEELTFSDEEIDAFLPKKFRRAPGAAKTPEKPE